jgi:choice-of-anchor B domain-containing protein
MVASTSDGSGRRGGKKGSLAMRSVQASLPLAAALLLAGTAASAAPVPCTGGFAGVYPCDKVDLLAQMPLTAIGGGVGNDVWGWTDPVSGREYAIIGLSNGTSFIDITDPVNPVFLGRLPAPPASPSPCTPHIAPAVAPRSFPPFVPEAPDHDECPPDTENEPLLGYGYPRFAPEHCGSDSQWRDHEVYADHLFIGSEQSNHGLVVFDLRLLRNVTTPPVTFPETARYCGFGNSHTITVNPDTGFVHANGTNAAICGGGKPHIVNVQVPGTPVFAGCDTSTNTYTHDAQCVVYHGPDVAHQGKSICINSNGNSSVNSANRLVISNVTNPAATALISSTGYPGAGYTHQGWLTADHRYFLLDDELDESDFFHNTRTYIWNFTDLDAPVLMGFHEHTTAAIDHQQFIFGNFSYQSNYRAGLRIMETKDIPTGQLTQVGFFDVYPANDNRGFNGTWSNFPFFRSGIVAVSTIESASPGGFFLVRPLFADLRVTVTDAPDPVAVGQNVTFTFTVTNQGPTWSTNTTLTDALPATMSFVSATPSQGTCTGTAVVSCNLGTLMKGDVRTVVIVARANAAGTITNSGVVSATENDTRLPDNTAVAQTTVTQSAQAVEPVTLAVDASGNGVLQPNEGTVTIAPSWRNVGTAAITLTGFASNFTGPAGPTYTMSDTMGAYPSMAPGDVGPCNDCYSASITATRRPAIHWDAAFQETVNPSATTKFWFVHVGDSFSDVPASSPFYRYVETLLHKGIAAGCSLGAADHFCPALSVTRAEIAPMLLIAKEGASYVPPPCTGMFGDVGLGNPFCPWIEELARRGVVTGCAPGLYCPTKAVNREQVAVLLLVTLDPTLNPPPCVPPNVYADVPETSPFCRWIEELAARGLVSDCGGGNYCPADVVRREQLSMFLTVTFSLSLYGA